jgi:hypothetical protein
MRALAVHMLALAAFVSCDDAPPALDADYAPA